MSDMVLNLEAFIPALTLLAPLVGSMAVHSDAVEARHDWARIFVTVVAAALVAVIDVALAGPVTADLLVSTGVQYGAVSAVSYIAIWKRATVAGVEGSNSWVAPNIGFGRKSAAETGRSGQHYESGR